MLYESEILAVPTPAGNCVYEELWGPPTSKVSWYRANCTTWDGPPSMISIAPIKARFEAASIKMNPILESFYRELVNVEEYGLNDLVWEIRMFRDDWSRNSEKNQGRISNTVREIFKYLPKLVNGEEEKRGLR